jgi:hypothetical protein
MTDSSDIQQPTASLLGLDPADDRHFIPAEALQVKLPVERVPVNIAEIVAEVRRSFGLIEAEKETPLPPIPPAVEADEQDEEEALLELEMEAEGYQPAMASAPEAGAVWSEDAAEAMTAYEQEVQTESVTVPEDEHFGDTDPLSDDEVFYRNRDQLYHPPDEPGRRTLLITAGILTFCVLVIIVYLLLDQSEPRELPGSAPVGRGAVACEIPTRA